MNLEAALFISTLMLGLLIICYPFIRNSIVRHEGKRNRKLSNEDRARELIAKEIYAPERYLMKRRIEPYDTIQEYEFVTKVELWDTYTIDSLYFMLQIFFSLNAVDRIDAYKDQILKFVVDRLDINSGGFRIGDDIDSITIHSNHCAIGVLKLLNILFNVNSKDREQLINRHGHVEVKLGKEDFQAMLVRANYDTSKCEAAYEALFDFVSECYSYGGGFKENRDKYPLPTISDTSSALWILNQLGLLEGEIKELRKIKFDEIDMFLSNLLDVKEYNGKKICGYRNKYGSEESMWLCSTYYAFRCYSDISLVIKDRRIFPDDETLLGVVNFIILCEKRGGGFGANQILTPNIVHTKDALSLLKRLRKLDLKNENSELLLQTEKKIKDKTLLFLEKTKYNNIFSFGPSEYFQPNVYAVNLALDIYRYLDIPIEERVKNSIIDFLFTCFDKTGGGCYGYSKDGKYINLKGLSYSYLDDEYKRYTQTSMTSA